MSDGSLGKQDVKKMWKMGAAKAKVVRMKTAEARSCRVREQHEVGWKRSVRDWGS